MTKLERYRTTKRVRELIDAIRQSETALDSMRIECQAHIDRLNDNERTWETDALQKQLQETAK